MAHLASALKDAGYCGDLWGMCGDEPEREGVRRYCSSESLQLMGISEIITVIPYIFVLIKETVSRVMREQPEAVVVIDSPDYHLRLITHLRRAGYKGSIFYIAPPTVWAWRRWRVKTLATASAECLPLFRHEHNFLIEHGCVSFWRGHPLIEEFSKCKSLNVPASLAGKDNIVAFFPGSRSSEVKGLLPFMTEAAQSIERAGWKPVFSIAPGLKSKTRELLASELDRGGWSFYDGPGRDLLFASTCAVGASGTLTLEAMLLERYLIVAYRLSLVSALIGRLLIKLPYFAMVNILAGKEIFPELIQGRLTVRALTERTFNWLNSDNAFRSKVIDDLRRVRRLLGESGAYAFWARKILEAIA